MLCPPRDQSVRPSIFDSVRVEAPLPLGQLVAADRESDMQTARAVVTWDGAAGHFDRLMCGAAAEQQQHVLARHPVGAQPVICEDRLEFQDVLIEPASLNHVAGVECGFQNSVQFRHVFARFLGDDLVTHGHKGVVRRRTPARAYG